MKKKLFIGVGFLLVVIIAAVFFIYSSLDSIIEKAIEKYGSEITQAKVSLDGVKISPTSGQGALMGLQIGNPKGFSSDYAINIGTTKITIDIKSITKDPIIIKEIYIDKPSVIYELTSKGNNFSAIVKNVQEYGGAADKKTKPADSKKAGKEGPKLIIEKLRINNGEVKVEAAALKGKDITTKLPNIYLKDIGKSKGGASPGEVAEKIMAILTKKIGSAVGSLDLNQIIGNVGNLQKELGGAIQNNGGNINKQVDEAGKKLKSLFK